MKLVVAVPSHDYLPALFAYDLGQLMSYTTSKLPDGGQMGLAMCVGTYVNQARTELLEAVLRDGADYVLWLDSDMRFPRDALVRLLSHQVPVVGVNYARREVPPRFTAVRRMRGSAGSEDPGEMLRTSPGSTGLVEVDSLGLGCVLMQLSRLTDLPDPRQEPWFRFGSSPDGDTIGEDVYFCTEVLRGRLGLRLFVDQDLSQECAHIGLFEYRCHMADAAYDEIHGRDDHAPGK